MKSPEQETPFFKEVMTGPHPNRKTGPELQAEQTERSKATQERWRRDQNHATEGFAPAIEWPEDPARSK